MTADRERIEELARQLTAIGRCRRCECPDCDPGLENHDHICTNGDGCIETPKRLRRALYAAAIVAGQAADELRRLARERMT